ncbi:MAG: hypothetical protein J3Q66DRAFT_183785 [Benniella sp.]|nr:MAG: hypothetical protein J3Q66DRAFT_183785 [Benniella sp.]
MTMAAFSVFTKAGTSLSPYPSTSARPPRAQSFAIVPLLVLSTILLSSLLIPLVESTSLHGRDLDSTSFPELRKVSFTPAFIGSSVDSELDFVAAAVPEQPQGGNLYKRAPPASETPKPTKKSKGTSTNGSKAPIPSTTTTIPMFTPDAMADMALFGKPSVRGAYNLTSGILIYSAFMIAFVVAVGTATWRRAKYRDQFRLQQSRNMEGGFVKSDKGSNGGATDEREDNSNSGYGVRFGDGNGGGNPSGATGRTGGMKKSNRDVDQGTYEMNRYRTDNSLDNHDTSDYTSPPLAELDPATYSSSGSSHSDYLMHTDDHPQVPKTAYQKPTFVQRTNSTRMPKSELQGLERNGSGSSSKFQSARTAVQGTLERSGSGNSAYSDADRRGPARSNSTRLPPSMRSGPQPPSGLSQSGDYQ